MQIKLSYVQENIHFFILKGDLKTKYSVHN